MKKNRIRVPLLLVALTLVCWPSVVSAQLPVEAAARPAAGSVVGVRALPLAAYYQDNPVVEVARSTLYGGLAGLALGLAAALVVDDSGEAVKWGFVIGTFGGFIWGVVHQTRSSSQLSVLEVRPGNGARVRLPSPRAFRLPDGRPGVRMGLLAVQFGGRRAP